MLSLIAVPVAFAHDVTISGTNSFAALDGSAVDHDHAVNGVFTVNDGNLIVNGTVNCNDDGASANSACAMAFVVSGNVTINAGGALYAENRAGNGSGGAISVSAGGSLTLNGNAIISASSNGGSSTSNGGNVSITAGAVTLGSTSTIDAGASGGQAGSITIGAGGVVTIAGNVLSGPSRALLATRLTGAVLNGGGGNQSGGAITIATTTFIEPALVVSSTANIVSQGEKNGAGNVTLDACGIEIRGLVAAVSTKDLPAHVIVRSGKSLLVDGRDLGATGTRMGRVRADALNDGATDDGVDLFARGDVSVYGPLTGSLFVVSSVPGGKVKKDGSGTIRVVSLEGAATVSGKAFIAGIDGKGTRGGTISIDSAGTATLDTATLVAIGDYTKPKKQSAGGHIAVRSYSGDVLWRNGTGDIRPVGSDADVPPADQGTIVLTACGTVNTTGSSFPTTGVATSVFPQTQTGVCSPAAPSLPAGTPPLVTCNTPPVANDTSASTNEDNAVTVHLSGSDADGDSLTFSIVTPPAHGSLGAVVSTGPTTADVTYTPALNYNGSDSFVYRANDGNGGTDDANATITIAPVNDPPSFLAGPTVTVLEDSGPKTVVSWATSISPGPADESAQSVTFTVTNDNNALFAVQPAVAPNGTLTFTPAANAYGSATITIVAHDNGGTANGGNDTSAPQTSTITVTAVNDPPSFTAGPNQTVNEDSGAQSVANWATSISAGPNESGQALTFHVSNDNNALFSAQPAVSPSGTLTYTPAANANGTAIVTVYLQDDGGTANGGVDTSATQTFTITVNAVNDEPSFTSGGNVSVLEDSGAYSAPWATSISAGPADESGQTVTFSTSNDNHALFSVQPSVASNGVLSFTPAANAFGTATVTVTLSDNGGTANGGDDTSPSQTFTITVNAVNDEPSFTSGGNISVLEDSGAYSAPWATGISAGPNESAQALTFHASNDNNALFSVQPSIAPDGTLTFTPAANANGTATVTVYLTDDGGTANGGDDTSPSQTFTINVTAVNDAPSFTSGGNVTVNEDSGAYSAPWATSISAGPADESGQTLTFHVTGNSNPSLFSVAPSIAPDGTLTFTPAANAFGSSTITVTLSDDGMTANGGADTSAPQSFTITVNNVNDEPSFTAGGNVTVNEDSGAYSAAWATGISAGPNEGSQTLTFHVSNDNNALFAAQPAISASGVLTFTPASNAFGTATVTVYLQDDGGTANGGDDTSASVTFQITINPVNDAPSFNSGGDVTVNEDSGAYTAPWATSVSAGPANESGQTLAFVITGNTNPSLFAAGPSIAPDGTLTFTPAANAFGSAAITVHLQDDGGTANGGADTSGSVTFNINVTSVNDPPSFTAGGNVTVNEDSGPYSATWATSISAGPGESQPLTFNVSNDNNALFAVQPAISPSGVLTFTPAPNAFGSANVTVTLSDGIDTTSPVTFVITVNGVNDPPTANNDTWETEGNTELRVDVGPSATPHVSDTTPSGRGVADNDADTVEGDPFSVTGIVGCADTTAPYVCSVAGGTVTMNANGSFSFMPSPGATSATFQYTVTDQPAAGIPASATGTVTITIHDMIWYVNGGAPAGGNGTSASPFNSFAPLNGGGDADVAGDYIFVHASTVNGGIALEPNEKLWGEGVGLIIPRNLNGNGSPTTLVAPGVKPLIAASVGNAVDVSSVSGVEIAGLALSAPTGNGIDVTSPIAGAAAGARIYSNSITAAGQQGIDISAFGPIGTDVSIDSTSIVSTGTGIALFGSDGTVTFSCTNTSIRSIAGSGITADASAADAFYVTGLANVSVDGATPGAGISVTGATFDANPSTAAFDTVNTGTLNIGSSVDPVGTSGLTLTNASGDVAIGTLNSFAATQALGVAGSGLFTGTTGLQLTSGGGSLAATAGVGLSVTNTTIGAANLSFTSVSAAGATNGIVLNNTGTTGGLKVLGTGSANSGGTIQNTTSHGVLLTNTTAPSFNNVRVQNTGGSGVKGTQVNGFTFTNGSIASSGTAGGADDSNIAFNTFTSGNEQNVSGVVTITGNTLTTALWNGIHIRNGNGVLANVIASNNTITSATTTAASKGTGINIELLGNASTVASLTKASFANNVISNFPSGGGIQILGGNANAAGPAGTAGIDGDPANVVSITGNSIKGLSPASRMGTNAIVVSVGGKGQGNFAVNNNGAAGNPITNVLGAAILVGVNGNAHATVDTSSNVIVANNSLGSAGISGGTGITFGNTDTPILSWTINGNSVSATDGNGILAVARGAAGQLKTAITNNVVAAPLTGARPGIRVDAGTAASTDDAVCLSISGNTSAGSGGLQGIGLRKQGSNPTINDFAIVGNPATSSPAVEAYVDGLNPAGGGTVLLSATTGFTNCTLP
ncbi:MAG: tandem-95 repeat protein [Acidobacteria bacterium]|nr:tandem-95 repeat protein [Acidobacteriota bacterium]